MRATLPDSGTHTMVFCSNEVEPLRLVGEVVTNLKVVVFRITAFCDTRFHPLLLQPYKLSARSNCEKARFKPSGTVQVALGTTRVDGEQRQNTKSSEAPFTRDFYYKARLCVGCIKRSVLLGL